MKILTINHHINEGRVTNRASFTNAETLFDFDVVIIQPPPFQSLTKHSPVKIPQGIRIDGHEYTCITTLWHKRSGELRTLLENNGILIVILAPFEKGYSSQQKECLDNYGWLRKFQYLPLITNGGGDGYQITNNSNPFVEYIRQGKLKWRAYLDFGLKYPKEWGIFAEIVKGKVIGATINVENGKIVFLPTLQEKNDEVLLGCIEKSFETYSETPPPDWIKEFTLSKEKERRQDIKKVQQHLEEIKKQEKDAKEKLKEITKFKKLLYETGKYQLEPIVRDAFRLLGFTVHDEYKPEPKSNIEIDALIECTYGQAIVEIKGRGTNKRGNKGKLISLDDFSQLTNKMRDDLKITGKLKEGILVGNGLRLCTPPKDRTGAKIFAPHVKESAERQSITLINTVDLYELVHSILDGKKIDRNRLQQKMLGSKGIFKFNEFIEEK